MERFNKDYKLYLFRCILHDVIKGDVDGTIIDEIISILKQIGLMCCKDSSKKYLLPWFFPKIQPMDAPPQSEQVRTIATIWYGGLTIFLKKSNI